MKGILACLVDSYRKPSGPCIDLAALENFLPEQGLWNQSSEAPGEDSGRQSGRK